METCPDVATAFVEVVATITDLLINDDPSHVQASFQVSRSLQSLTVERFLEIFLKLKPILGQLFRFGLSFYVQFIFF